MASIADVQSKVDNVKRKNDENLQNIAQNIEDLAQTDVEAATLMDKTEVVKKEAVKVKRHECTKAWRLYLIIAITILVILGIILGVYFWRRNQDSQQRSVQG